MEPVLFWQSPRHGMRSKKGDLDNAPHRLIPAAGSSVASSGRPCAGQKWMAHKSRYDKRKHGTHKSVDSFAPASCRACICSRSAFPHPLFVFLDKLSNTRFFDDCRGQGSGSVITPATLSVMCTSVTDPAVPCVPHTDYHSEL